METAVAFIMLLVHLKIHVLPKTASAQYFVFWFCIIYTQSNERQHAHHKVYNH